jgi:hypothetical protein
MLVRGEWREERIAKVSEGFVRKDLRKDVGNVEFRRDELEDDVALSHLLPEPSHLNAEMAVSAGDNMVFDHRYAGLVIFIDDRGGSWRQGELGDCVGEPDNITGGTRSSDELGFGRT